MRSKRLKVHAQDEASGAIEEHLDLSQRDSQAFVEALINPRPVNDRLRQTIRRYRQAVGV
jgi:uncharacterized protein (DUF1778 family)